MGRDLPGPVQDPRAGELLARYHERFAQSPQLPVPVEAIAEDLLGLSVGESEALEVSGMLLPAERQVWLNATEVAPRRRFTLAHEVGRTSDVVVLTPRSIGQSKVVGEVGAFRLNESPSRRNDVRLSSIKRFLGLEARVVVLCELPEPLHPDFRSLMYVGLSRARALLVILGDPKLREGLEADGT
jgi:hypothetical protein